MKILNKYCGIKIKLLILLLIICATQRAIAQQSFNGTINDIESREPLPMVNLFINELNRSTTTNEEGKFSFKNIPNGYYTINLKCNGYNTEMIEYNTEKGAKELNITLTKSAIEMNDVVVSGIRNSLQEKSTLKIEVLNMNTFRQNGNITVMDALNNMPGISVISTGPGIARPVIRGLSGNRIATIINGVKLENQQWDLEHTLGIKQYGISKIEIIKGAASFLYGSDAMGGVINFIDEKPAPTNTIMADVVAGFYTNTFGSISEVGIKQTKEHLFWGFRVGLNNHSDYYDASDKRVANSRFRELTAKTYLGLNYKKSVTLFSYQTNIGYYGIVEPFENDSTVKEMEDHPMEFETPYHTLQHHILSAKNTLFLGKSKLISSLSYQYDGRNELEKNDTEAKPFLGLALHNTNADVRFTHQFNKNILLTTGFQGVQTWNKNDGYSQLIPNYSQTDMAAYLLNQNTFFHKKLNIDIGLRYDLRNVQSTLYGTKDSANYMLNINKKFDNISSSIGANFEANKYIHLYANAGMAYRAPNMAELTSNGVRLETQRYEKGNADFKKETNLMHELGINFANKNIGIAASVFSNLLSNYIYLVNTGDSVTAKIDGTYRKMQVYQFKQNDASFMGAEMKFELHPYTLKWLAFSSTYSNTTAQIVNGSALPQIPPYKLFNELLIKHTILKAVKESYMRISYNYTWAQNSVFTNEMTTPSYHLVNLSFGGNVTWFKQTFMLAIGANNLFNVNYYDHLSRLRQYGVQGMGINVFFTIKVPLQIK